jgi:Lrp/AsnC family leucine-responsive transcriptional regulator
MLNGEQTVDDLDRKILALLTENARLTLGAIAREVSLSPSAVKRRIGRLEQAGIIAGYSVVVDYARVGKPVQAIVELRCSGILGLDEIRALAAEVPEVTQLFTTAGDPDAVAWLRARDVNSLRGAIDGLRRTGGVVGTKTLVVLDVWERGLPPSASSQRSRRSDRG